MNMTAEFIAARALSLAYEAIAFPETAKVATTWIGRARRWATQHGLADLEQTLNAHLVRIGTHYQEIAEAA